MIRTQLTEDTQLRIDELLKEAKMSKDIMHDIETESLFRDDILDQAKSIINGARENTYGRPEDSFGYISELWSGYLEQNITKHDVAMMMCLLKIARAKNGYHIDNYVDICGYAAIAGEFYKGNDYL